MKRIAALQSSFVAMSGKKHWKNVENKVADSVPVNFDKLATYMILSLRACALRKSIKFTVQAVPLMYDLIGQ